MSDNPTPFDQQYPGGTVASDTALPEVSDVSGVPVAGGSATSDVVALSPVVVPDVDTLGKTGGAALVIDELSRMRQYGIAKPYRVRLRAKITHDQS